MRKSVLFRTVAGAAAAMAFIAALHPSALAAQTQSLTWTETMQVEVPGTLGAMLSASGVTDPQTSTHTLHLQGSSLIQEDDQSAVVIDVAGGRWLTVDHEGQSYLTMSFAEMGQLSEEAMDAAYASAASGSTDPSADARTAREELARALEEAKATIDVRVRSEETGQRQSFGPGINGQQHFITTEFEISAVPEGVEQREGGSLVFLAELWQTSDVPSTQALHEEWARQTAANAGGVSASEEMQRSAEAANAAIAESLAGWDPQIGAGLLSLSEAIQELDGLTVRSVTTVALVPLGVELNRAELLAWEPATMGDELRAGAANVARQAAADAARGAVRGLTRGLLGGRGNDAPAEPTPAADAPRVHPLLRITTTRENVSFRESNDDVLAALNARIAGYDATTYQDISAELRQ